MSTELVKSEIKKFLISSNPEVLSIKGAWGVGKTYCWDSCIKEFKNDCVLKKYSYVSLFGISSLNELKQSIFLNSIDMKNVDKEKNFKSIFKNLGHELKDTKIPVIGKYTSFLNSAFNSISLMAVTDTIICFDDLERRSDKLKMKDFLGLASHLKDRKNCKVVFLLNEDANDEDANDFKKYKEKVIDKQLEYKPTSEESFDVMFKEDLDQKKIIREFCLIFKISNKRVLKKIVDRSNEILSLIKDNDEIIKEHIVHSIVIFSWCYYCQESNKEEIPDFEFLKQTGYRKPDSERGWNEEIVKKWREAIFSYNYSHTDDIGLLIADSIDKGFLDDKKLIALVKEKQNEIDIQRTYSKFQEAWELFHGSFDFDEDLITEKMQEGLSEIASTASCFQYSQGIKVLRDIGSIKTADMLIELFIEKRKENPEVFNLKNAFFNSFSIEDSVFRDRLNKAYEDLTPKLTVQELLELRRHSNSYNDSDPDILNKLSADEIKELFLSKRGDDRNATIRTFFLLSGLNTELRDKVKNALDAIGNSSPLNKRRIESITK